MTFLAEFAEIQKNRNQSKTSAIFCVRHNINCSFFTMGGSSQIVHLNFFRPEATYLHQSVIRLSFLKSITCTVINSLNVILN